MVPLGVWRAHRHRVVDHRRIMIGVFSGALVIAGLFTLLPGRIMHTVVFAIENARWARLHRSRLGSGSSPRGGQLSNWKNEGKIGFLRGLRGGFTPLDALYETDSELTGFSLV